MPEDEGLALHAAACAAAAGGGGPLLEVGTYCGKSAVYLGAAARAAGTVLFTLDHHRGSGGKQSGWGDHHTQGVGPPPGVVGTLPVFRPPIADPGPPKSPVWVVCY